MTRNREEKVVLRARFWPRLLRWAVCVQLGFGLLVGLTIVLRGLNGRPLYSAGEGEPVAALSVVFAVVALILAARRRNLGSAEITPLGIRPYTLQHGWYIRYRWAEMDTVRVKAGPFGNRWLEVVPKDAPPFKLVARPTDPVSVLDALERFAGPDHPLTLAMAEVVEVGR